MELKVGLPDHEEGKLNRLLEGTTCSFPGNASLTQFFQLGFTEGRIDSQKVALQEEEDCYTFKQLDEASNILAEIIRAQLGFYRNHNPDQDAVIGVCIPPSNQLIISLIAILKLGAAYLPIDVSFPENRVIKIVKDCKPIMIISDSHSNVLKKFELVRDYTKVVSTDELNQLKKTMTLSQEELAENKTEPLSGLPALAERTAIVLYTSGSSGEPKGVRLTHRTILNRLHWQWEAFPFNEGEKCVFKTSLTFVDSVAEIFGALLQGQGITVFSKATTSNPNMFIKKLNQYGITRLVLVPSLLKAIFQTISVIGIAEGRKMVETVKLWVCSGEAMTKDLLMEFFENFPTGFTICNFYGSTEVMGDVTYVSFSGKKEVYEKTLENHVPIGLPINNTVIYVLDSEMEMSHLNQTGQIYVTGYNLAKSYVGMNEHSSFVPNPFSKTPGFQSLYKTGDFGRISETQGKQKMLIYEGRIDSQIKVRGQRVDLSEVELTIASIDLISKVKVLCYNPGGKNQAIVAYIVPSSEAHFDRIKSLVETRLRDYERPILRKIDEIPLLVNGKTDRQRLLKMYEQEIEEREDFVNWGSLELSEQLLPIAKIVLQTISEVTGSSIETIAENIENSFFNVGGSSLNAIVVIVKLREAGFQININDFVNAKTIKQIVYVIASLDASKVAEEWYSPKEAKAKYKLTPLINDDLDEVANIIAYSFSHHGDLEMYTHGTYDEFQTLIRSFWKELVQKGFSFIIRNKKDKRPLAVSLNFDVYDEPSEVDASQGIAYVLELLEFLESRQREKLPKGKGKLLHSFMMGTAEEVDESENVFLIDYMEEEIINLAIANNFVGIMTTNTSPLTQQLSLSVHGYEVLSDYQVNKYIAPDGTKPFLLAPDTFKIICCWKKVPQANAVTALF